MNGSDHTSQTNGDTRRFRIYAVGIARSGTHSVAKIFKTQYRAAHEPEARDVVPRMCDLWDGICWEGASLHEYLRVRDRRLNLELEASNPLAIVAGDLAELFDDARFLLTVRRPRAWLDSQFNFMLDNPQPPQHWKRWRDVRFGGAWEYSQHEQVLADLGLYTVDGYLSHWARHYQLVLDSVPPERLMVIRTEDLGVRLRELAEFAGVSEESLDGNRAHASRSQPHGILDQLDAGFVGEKIWRHCEDAARRLDDLLASTAMARRPGVSGSVG